MKNNFFIKSKQKFKMIKLTSLIYIFILLMVFNVKCQSYKENEYKLATTRTITTTIQSTSIRATTAGTTTKELLNVSTKKQNYIAVLISFNLISVLSSLIFF